MYDILDAEWDSLTITNNSPSRSNSMHKITKTDSKLSPKSQLNKNNSNKSDFDQLLNSVLNKDSKVHHNSSNSTIKSSHRLQIDTLDSNHEDIRWSHNNNKNSTQHPSAFQRTSLAVNFSSKDIEDHGINRHFGNTQKSILNPSKINDSIVSTRNMRPPLKPKDNLHTQSFNFADSSASVIPEEDPALTNSSHNRSNSFKRRSSIDSRSELTDDVMPLRNKPFAGGTVHSVNFDTIKEDVFSNINKSESCVVGEFKSESEQGNSGNNFFRAKDKLQIKSESLKVGFEQQIKQGRSQHSTPGRQMKEIVAQYQKQLQTLKSTYQKQITHLQQCLNAQLQQNRNLRQTLMQESNKILQQERTRTHRIHEEEISRLKEIFLWQHKKQEETFTLQIQSLKASLDLVNGHHNWMQTNQKPVEQNIEFMQIQLQSKEQRLDNKMKLVEQRQLQLERKQSELNIKVRREEERLRSQEKRITQMEFEFKKMMMQEKKYHSEQKQELALELGAMESDFHKRKQQLQLREKQVQLQFQSLEQQKRCLQSINSQAMNKQRVSMQQLQRQKERVKDLQIQLIQKLRVVETRAKELSLLSNNHEDWLPCRKQNNWLDHSYTKSNNHHSTGKKLNNSNSMSNMAKTKERFDLLERNTKSKLAVSREAKKIDLSNYISRVENNMQSRQA